MLLTRCDWWPLRCAWRQVVIAEVLPKAGLVYSEKGNLSEVLCKPKIMPIKSLTLEKLEHMEQEAAATAAATGQSPKSNSAACCTATSLPCGPKPPRRMQLTIILCLSGAGAADALGGAGGSEVWRPDAGGAGGAGGHK